MTLCKIETVRPCELRIFLPTAWGLSCTYDLSYFLVFRLESLRSANCRLTLAGLFMVIPLSFARPPRVPCCPGFRCSNGGWGMGDGRFGNVELLKMLKRAGGDPNITNALGLTPLSYSCAFKLSLSTRSEDSWGRQQVTYY